MNAISLNNRLKKPEVINEACTSCPNDKTCSPLRRCANVYQS